MTHVFDPGNGYIVIDGQVVESDALRVAEELKKYDPNLEVICRDPAYSEVNEAPFIICEYVNGVFKRIFEAWQLDDRVIARVKMADTQAMDVYSNLVEVNEVNYQRKQQRFRDIMEEKKDLVSHVAAMKRSKYSFKDQDTGEKVTLFDDRPSERKSFNLSRSTTPVGRMTFSYGSHHAI